MSCPTRFSTAVHSIPPYCRFPVLLFDVRKAFFGNGIFLSKYVPQRCGIFSRKPSPPLLSSLIDNTVNSLLERWTSEIDDKPDPKPKHLQIGSALGAEHLVSRRLRHRLAFDNHLVLNEKVEFLGVLVSYLEDMSLVDDRYRLLPNNLKAVLLQFPFKGGLVGTFLEARSAILLVNLYGKSNDPVSQFVLWKILKHDGITHLRVPVPPRAPC